MITENKLKEVTPKIIGQLNVCNIRTIMATGDNTLTAISVARHCGILGEDQIIYYADVENEEIVWRKADTLDDEMGGRTAASVLAQEDVNTRGTLQQTVNKEVDTKIYVPW